MDDSWKALEVELESPAFNGNGSNGHGEIHGSDIFGPTVELAPVLGHTLGGNRNGSSTAGGDGHHAEAEEPQRLVISWVEFMAEETVKPRRRNRKPQPASMSMFE